MSKREFRKIVQSGDDASVSIAGICNAARAGDLDRVRAILKQKPELARRDGAQGYQAIHHAAREGHLEVVRLLLAAGASPTRVTYRERVSAIDMARHHGHTKVAEAMEAWRFRQTGETETGILLCRAAGRGDIEGVRELLDRDPSGIHSVNRSGDTALHVAERGAPLHAAAANDDLEMATLLLAHGASAHTVMDASGNAFDLAISNGNHALEKLLLRHGAFPGYDNEITPGFYAQHSDNITVDAALVKSDPSCVKDVLNGAVHGGHPDLVDLCLSQNPDFSESEMHDVMCLAMRVWRLRCPSKPGKARVEHFYTCFELLLDHGFDPNARAKEGGLTPLHWTAEITWYVSEQDRIVFAEKLLNHGAEINTLGGERQSTPLAMAVRHEWPELARFMLEAGADPNLAGAQWATPLAWSEKPQGHKEYERLDSKEVDMGALLRRYGAKK